MSLTNVHFTVRRASNNRHGDARKQALTADFTLDRTAYHLSLGPRANSFQIVNKLASQATATATTTFLPGLYHVYCCSCFVPRGDKSSIVGRIESQVGVNWPANSNHESTTGSRADRHADSETDRRGGDMELITFGRKTMELA